jgi:enoyl-CoA hydratase/carnithine racemase
VTSSTEADTIIRIEGRAGRITLNRPQALNALTYDMALDIEKALLDWQGDPAVDLVIIDAAGDKAFCAGGDIQVLYQTGTAGDYDYARRFWADEYRLNALIADYEKPYVALMDGIVMGGGVGLSAHGSHRIVTDRTMLAMPECGIGLITDVGGTFVLGHAPGYLGTYLGLTGTRLKADGALYTGFADDYVPHDRLADLTAKLVETGDTALIAEFTEAIEPGNLRTVQPEIDAVFSADDPVEILHKLDDAAVEGSWQEAAAKAMHRGSPLSILCTHRAIVEARGMDSLREALKMEYRFVSRCMEHADFLEGVRAQIIDKDRNPKWRHASLEAARGEAEKLLAPLGEAELKI